MESWKRSRTLEPLPFERVGFAVTSGLSQDVYSDVLANHPQPNQANNRVPFKSPSVPTMLICLGFLDGSVVYVLSNVDC